LKDELENSEFEIDRTLDLRGWSCPWCIVKTKSWLKRMEPGRILAVLCTDPDTLSSFPAILKTGSDRIIELKQFPDYHRLLVRRG